MTDEMMNLRALVEKTPDADLLREMIGFAAQRLMELEVEGVTGAVYGEKNPDRLVYSDPTCEGERRCACWARRCNKWQAACFRPVRRSPISFWFTAINGALA